MLSRLFVVMLWLGHAAPVSAALPAACRDAPDAWPSCLGTPAADSRFAVADPAITLYRQLDLAGESPRERSSRLKQLANGDDAQAVIALTQLGRQAAHEGKLRLFHRPYRQALERKTVDPELNRYRHHAYATACSHAGEIDCALSHWHLAAVSAPAGASWLPETWAIALWHADAKDAAIAWYQAAVLSNGSLGRNREVAAETSYDNPMSHLRRDLFNAWSQRFATETATVRVDVDIDAQGRIIRAQLPAKTDLHPELRARVQASVVRWQFDPLPEQGDSGVLSTLIEVDVRRHSQSQNGTAAFDIQFVRMGTRVLDYEHRKGLRYPRSAAARRAQGVTVLRVLPANDGSVDQIHILKSSGHDDLDDAATKAVATWQFSTPRIDGKPIVDWFEVPIDFQIVGSEPVFVPEFRYGRTLQQRFPY